MPTYGYQCTLCNNEFSVFQSMKDDPVAACPECSGPVKRLLYPVGIVFKGTGWYINDSRKPEKSETAASTDSGGDGDNKAADSTSDSKTETKSETKSETAPAKSEPAATG